MENTKARRLRLFLFCSIPGLLLIALSVIYAIDGSISIISSCVLIFVGIILTLIGLGKLKKWRYGLVVLSIPISVILYLLISVLLGAIDEYIFSHIPFISVSVSGKSGLFWIFMAIIALSTYYLVDKSYRKDEKDSKNIQEQIE